MYYLYLLLMYWNICKFLFFLSIFYLYCHIGYRKDEYRNYYANKITSVMYNAINYTIGNKIVYINNSNLTLEHVNVINANHIHSFDFLIMLHLFKKNNVFGKSVTSISVTDDKPNLEKKVFNILDSCIIKQKNSFIQNYNNIKHKTTQWLSKKYPSLIIFFAEGITRLDMLKKKIYKVLFINHNLLE